MVLAIFSRQIRSGKDLNPRSKGGRVHGRRVCISRGSTGPRVHKAEGGVDQVQAKQPRVANFRTTNAIESGFWSKHTKKSPTLAPVHGRGDIWLHLSLWTWLFLSHRAHKDGLKHVPVLSLKDPCSASYKSLHQQAPCLSNCWL